MTYIHNHIRIILEYYRLNDDPTGNRSRIVDFYVVPYSLSNFTESCLPPVDLDLVGNKTEQALIEGPIVFSYDVIFKVN